MAEAAPHYPWQARSPMYSVKRGAAGAAPPFVCRCHERTDRAIAEASPFTARLPASQALLAFPDGGNDRAIAFGIA